MQTVTVQSKRQMYVKASNQGAGFAVVWIDPSSEAIGRPSADGRKVEVDSVVFELYI